MMSPTKSRTSRFLFAIPIAPFFLMLCSHAYGSEFGSYNGPVEARWSDIDKTMELLKPLIYKAPDGQEWIAPKGSVIDGASIPQVAMSFIGGGFDGPYRNASVIHDVACNERIRPWEDVHRTFYYGMRASGVPEFKAKVMYAAVYHFGPRWAYRHVTLANVPFDVLPSKIDALRKSVKNQEQFSASVFPYSLPKAFTDGGAKNITVPLPAKQTETGSSQDEWSGKVVAAGVRSTELEPTTLYTRSGFEELPRTVEPGSVNLLGSYITDTTPEVRLTEETLKELESVIEQKSLSLEGIEALDQNQILK
ncbi:DUF1353 domain-containing protein [Rheinheimera sp.]|uniref:DUF1353 domain-containing protein n=1 Tax=Rheinheimera sp. TaxID=1869214 RepID=UPI003D2C9D44